MEELEFIVLRKVKDLIENDLPQPGFVDGPWKILAERLAFKNKASSSSISPNALEHVRKEIFKVSNIDLTVEQVKKLMEAKKADGDK